ncbi:MAG: glycosyltransferase family 2 protein [Gemmatimonadetes bacterium]|nr:glycosyltransferase family 2 protein [Gemmatimonadota bacterium]
MTNRPVTVAICTWNRAALLRETLARMTALDVPAGLGWELVVVNNNCTDDTDAVLAQFTDRLPLRRVAEPTPGLSNARNAAVRAAGGRWIVWTDDDVLVSSGWLSAYLAAFAADPEAVVFGGPIRPWFPATPPAWLTAAWSRVAPAYACIDYGDAPFPLDSRRVPFGANMAFAADALRAHPFDPARGVRPGSRMGGEETDVVRALLAGGGRGRWVPEAIVDHWIPPERQTIAYLQQWFEAYGEYLGRYDPAPDPALFLGAPRWRVRQLVVSSARAWWRRLLGAGPEAWLEDGIAEWTARGALRGHAARGRGVAS